MLLEVLQRSLVALSQDTSLWFQLEPNQSHFIGNLASLLINTTDSLRFWLALTSGQVHCHDRYKLQRGALSRSGANTARQSQREKDLRAERSFDYWYFVKTFTVFWCYRAGLGPSTVGTMLQLILSVTLRDWLTLWLACDCTRSLGMCTNCKVHSFSVS